VQRTEAQEGIAAYTDLVTDPHSGLDPESTTILIVSTALAAFQRAQ
jgi:hypothetical protein